MQVLDPDIGCVRQMMLPNRVLVSSLSRIDYSPQDEPSNKASVLDKGGRMSSNGPPQFSPLDGVDVVEIYHVSKFQAHPDNSL